MIFKVIADLLVVVHFTFIVFVALGGLLVLRWRKITILHLPCVLWGVLVAFKGWICPLTSLENHFLKLAGDAGYSGGFISHYMMPLVYPEGLTRGMQISLGVGVLTVNFCVYLLVLVSRTNRKKKDL